MRVYLSARVYIIINKVNSLSVCLQTSMSVLHASSQNCECDLADLLVWFVDLEFLPKFVRPVGQLVGFQYFKNDVREILSGMSWFSTYNYVTYNCVIGCMKRWANCFSYWRINAAKAYPCNNSVCHISFRCVFRDRLQQIM